MDTETPLATYAERLVQVGRVFELYADRVVVSAKWLWKRPYQTTVLLAALKPDYHVIPIRYRLFKHGLLAFAVGATVAAFFGKSAGTLLQQIALLGGWSLATLGIMVSTATFRKVLFVRFPPLSGRGGLDIAQSGPDRARFEEFVKVVQRQIRRAKKA